jgi:hypothetical protein
MTEQTTYPVNATVGQDGEVSVQHSEPVTGSPQAIIYLHANFTEVGPQDADKTLAERLDEAYRNDHLEPQEREFLELAQEHFSRLDDE